MPLNVSSGGDDFVEAYKNGLGAPLSVADADGTVYHFPNPDQAYVSGTSWVTLADWVQNRNGNKVTISSGSNGSFSVTDELQRTAVQSTGFRTSEDDITVSGLSNPYRVAWETMLPGYPTQHVPEVGNGNGDCFWGGGNNVPFWIVKSIGLPNGTSYQFTYNSYGLVNQITYPTGATVSYQWGVTTSPTGYVKLQYPDNAPTVISLPWF